MMNSREGGITSPDSFNAAYGEVLWNCSFDRLPTDPFLLAPDKVYYLAFADDLVVMSCDSVKLNSKLGILSEQLSRFGMTMNAEKTKVMCFPGFFIGPHPCFSVSGSQLEFVDSFKYLGFHIDSNLSWDKHRDSIQSRAVTASNQVGALLCRLKVSNVEKLRLFFVAFVLSQLYGKELMSLKGSILQDLAHSFLVKCLSLPRSFPKIICFALLGVPPLNWQQARMFARFIQRIFEGEGKLHPAASCFLWDRLLCHEFLFCWFSEFSFLFEGAIPVDEVVDLNPLLLSVDRLDAILRVENNSLLSGLRQSASFFFLEIFPSGVASPNFRRTLGSLDYEDARLFVLFLGNSWRWSVFRTPRRACFCDGPRPFLNLVVHC